MGNTMQQNPSNASDDDNLWPDWNSAAGTGVEAREDEHANRDFQDIYEKQREGAKARLEDKK